MAIEIIEEFFRGDVRIIGDESHSKTEERFIAFGRTSNDRPIFIGFTYRQAEVGFLIRPITARFMHRKEVEQYEKAFTEIEDR